jgi:hypothetical protein
LVWKSDQNSYKKFVPSGHLGSGTNNYDFAPKPRQPLRFGDGFTHAAVVPDLRSLLQPPAIVLDQVSASTTTRTSSMNSRGLSRFWTQMCTGTNGKRSLGKAWDKFRGSNALLGRGFYFGAFTGYDPPSVNLKPISHNLLKSRSK